MNDGWIKLHRQLLSSDMYQCLTSAQRDVFFQCLMLANYSEKEWEWKGKIYKCERGQFITSISKLAERCASDVTEKQVRSAIAKLEKWGFLGKQTGKQGTIVTICNYSRFQDDSDSMGKPMGKIRANDGQLLRIIKKEKNKDIDQKQDQIDINFERFWKAYPKRVGRGKVEKIFRKINPDEKLMMKILTAIAEQKNSSQWQDKKYVPHPSTWLNQKRWEDEMEHNNIFQEINTNDFNNSI